MATYLVIIEASTVIDTKDMETAFTKASEKLAEIHEIMTELGNNVHVEIREVEEEDNW